MTRLPLSWRAGLLFAIGVTVFGPSLTHAQTPAEPPEDEDEARMHFRLGAAYHESGRFAEAAREFEMAYELSQRPALLHNMFVAHRDAGNIPGAIRALREYLRLVPDAEDRVQLTRRLANLEHLAEEQGLDVDAPSTPEPVAPAASAGAGTAAASDGGGGGTWVPGWIIAGVGVAAIIGGAIAGGLALGEQSSLDAMCDADHACDPGFEATRDSAGLLAGLSDVLWISGGVIAAAGLVLALTVSEGGGDTTAAVMCHGAGCVAVARTRF